MNSDESPWLVWIVCGVVLAGIAFAGAPPLDQNWFAWVPPYPGAQIVASSTTEKDHQLTYKCELHVKDSGAAVRSFYEKKLGAAGFKFIGKGGITGNSWDLYAESPDGMRTIDLSGDAQLQGAKVRITARRTLSRSYAGSLLDVKDFRPRRVAWFRPPHV